MDIIAKSNELRNADHIDQNNVAYLFLFSSSTNSIGWKEFDSVDNLNRVFATLKIYCLVTRWFDSVSAQNPFRKRARMLVPPADRLGKIEKRIETLPLCSPNSRHNYSMEFATCGRGKCMCVGKRVHASTANLLSFFLDV